MSEEEGEEEEEEEDKEKDTGKMPVLLKAGAT